MPDTAPAAHAIQPLRPRPEVSSFLETRRSRPAKTLRAPAPDRAALEAMLRIAARVPDHGKLEPWRFVVLSGAALPRLADAAVARAGAVGLAEDRQGKLRAMFADAPCMVAVVAAPVESATIPDVEQVLSAGAACFALCAAAQAAGWGANWLTGAMAYDDAFLRDALGLEPGQWVAGYVVIGTEGPVPPERPRPDMDRVVRWTEA